MGLSSSIISQFAKATNDTKKKSTESTHYGTIVEYNGSTYAKLDGSEQMTPVATTTEMVPGQRVIVLLKNHTATVTGNISSPSASSNTVRELGSKITTVEVLMADKVSTEVLNAQVGRIDQLTSDNVTINQKLTANEASIQKLEAADVTITGRLDANDASIKNLESDNVTIKDTLNANKANIETLVADNATINEKLTANEASIKTLEADNATINEKLTTNEAIVKTLQADNVTINETLTAQNGEIANLKTNKLDADQASITYATIVDLDSANANITNLTSEFGEFKTLTTDNFTAANAKIDDLYAKKLSADEADIKYATIEKLNAAVADIELLDADIADINTLIFGSASGSSIQTSFANAVIAQLGNAQIKSAMIDSVSASKITAGDIITNNVRVKSEDGSLLISDETIQISDENRVRVQIGKDAANDYSINIWDENGNLMFSKGGITDSAIKSAIIRNDMVSDTANVSAHKLNIDSLFDEIDDSTRTIKSSKIYVDSEAQTLDVAFTEMNTEISGVKESVSSQGTQLSVIQGQISSKIWQTDIDTSIGEINDTVDLLSTNYSELTQEVDGISATVASHTTLIANKADKSTLTSVESKVTELEANLDGFKSTVSSTYVTQDALDDYSTTEQMNSAIDQKADSITTSVSNTYATKAALNTTNSNVTVAQNTANSASAAAANAQKAADDAQGDVDELATNVTTNYATKSEVTQTAESIKSTVSSTYATKTALEDTNEKAVNAQKAADDAQEDVDNLSENVTTNYATKSEVTQTAESITSTVESTYATKTELSKTDQKATNAQSTADTAKTNASTAQNTANTAKTAAENAQADVDSLTETVTTDYATKSEVTQTAESITSTVASTYATKSALATTNNNVTTAQSTANTALTNAATAQTAADNAQNDINNLSIGGRNLALGTATPYVITGTNESNQCPSLYRMSVNWQDLIGETVTLSFDYEYSEGATVTKAMMGYHVTPWDRFVNFTLGDSSKGHATGMYTVPATVGSHSSIGPRIDYLVGSVTISNLKLERGNRETDWTPAPDDMATENDLNALTTRVTNAETKVTQNANSITSLATRTTTVENKFANYSTTEQMNSAIEQKADSITSTVSETYATKSALATTDTKASNAATAAANAQSTADTAVTNAAAAQEDIDNLVIGGRNIFRQSGRWETLPTWWNSNGGGISLDTSEKYLGYNTLKTTVGNGIVGNNYAFLELDTNKVYTYSAMVKSDASYTGNGVLPLHYHCATNSTDSGSTAGVTVIGYDQTLVADEWKLIYVTFRPKGAWFRPFVYIGSSSTSVFNIAYLKLEEGNRPTDWTPAPEDLASSADMDSLETRVTTAETNIIQNANSITSIASRTTTVENKFGNYSTTEQMNSAISQSASSITSSVASTYATKSALSTTDNYAKQLSGDGTNYAKLNNDTASYYGFAITDTSGGDWYTMNTLKRDTQISPFYECSGGEKIKIEYEVSSSAQAITTNGGSTIDYVNVGVGVYTSPDSGNENAWPTVSIASTAEAPVTTVSNTITLASDARRFRVCIQLAGWGSFSGTVKVRNIRVSKLNALGDRVSSAESNITQLSDRISAEVTERTTLGTRVSTVEQTASGLSVRLSSAEGNISTAQATASAAQSAINDLVIGGRNLLLGTDDPYNNFSYSMANGTKTITRETMLGVNGVVLNIITASTSWYYAGYKFGAVRMSLIKPSTYYTFSVDVYPSVTTSLNFSLRDGDSTDIATSENSVSLTANVWNHVSLTVKSKSTITIDSQVVYLLGIKNVGSYKFCNFKLEEGTRATDWTPAPEDVAATATNYLNFSTEGLVVGDMTASTLGRNVLIHSSGVNIRNNTSILASFEDDSIELGRHSKSAKIDLCKGTATLYNEASNNPDLTYNKLVIAADDAIYQSAQWQIINEAYYDDTSHAVMKIATGTPWSDTSATVSPEINIFTKKYTTGKTTELYMSEDYINLESQWYDPDSITTSGGGAGTGEFPELEITEVVLNGWANLRLDATANRTYIGAGDRIVMESPVYCQNLLCIPNSVGLYGKDTGNTNRHMIGMSENNNVIVGYGVYSSGIGNTHIYGNKIYHYVKTAGVNYKPYYEAGDSITLTLYTGGFISSSSKNVYFTVPIAKPIIGSPTISVTSVDGITVRQNNQYLYGSSGSAYTTPSSYSAAIIGQGTSIRVVATMSNTTNATNNSPCGITASIKITFS